MPGAPHGGHTRPRDAAEASQSPPTQTGQGTDPTHVTRSATPPEGRAGGGSGRTCQRRSSPTLRTGSGRAAPPLLCKWENRGRGGDRLRVGWGLSLVVSSAQGSSKWALGPGSGFWNEALAWRRSGKDHKSPGADGCRRGGGTPHSGIRIPACSWASQMLTRWRGNARLINFLVNHAGRLVIRAFPSLITLVSTGLGHKSLPVVGTGARSRSPRI